MEPKYVVVFLWFAWLVSWLAASNWAKETVKAPARRNEVPYRILQTLGFAMVFMSLGQSASYEPEPGIDATILAFLFSQVWEPAGWLSWIAVLLTAGGFAFAWWARLHLGELWSSSVTRKQDHTVIDSGPYGIVRHPIYTGMLLATIAVVLISGRWLALIGFIVVIAAIWVKARLEERFLREELGPEAYGAYAKRVPMLVPGSPV